MATTYTQVDLLITTLITCLLCSISQTNLHKFLNQSVIFLWIGVDHINDELYNQLITIGITIVATKTKVTYRRNSYYMVLKSPKMAKFSVALLVSCTWSWILQKFWVSTSVLLSTLKFKPPVIIILYGTMARYSKNLNHSQSCQPLSFLQNHYDFLFFITPLRPYSENYDPFSCNSSICCSYVTVLAADCITQLASCISWSIPRLLLVLHSLCGAYHMAVALGRMAWKTLLRQQIGMVHFFPGGLWILWRWYKDNKNCSGPGLEKLVAWILSLS